MSRRPVPIVDVPELLDLATAILAAADSKTAWGSSGTTRPTEKQWTELVNNARRILAKRKP